MLKKIFIALGLSALVFGVGYIFLKIPNNTSKQSGLQSFRKSFCGLLGGQMLSSGCGLSNCTESCKFSKRDGGKICNSSKDCSGKCVVEQLSGANYSFPHPETVNQVAREFDCSEKNGFLDCKKVNFQGKCQKNPLKNCEAVWEYDNGAIRQVTESCSL